MNAGKSKVIVGNSGGNMIVNSVQCTVCKKLIHKRCSGMRGDLSRVADGFRCIQCDGTIQEVDLSEELMVDGEAYECVKSFCYLGDTLDGDGGAGFQRLPPARGGTAQKKIIHLANWSQLIHPGPASSLTKFFLVSSQSCVSTLTHYSSELLLPRHQGL